MKTQPRPSRRDPPTTKNVALDSLEPHQPHAYLTRIDVYLEEIYRLKLDRKLTGVHIGPEYAKPISRDPQGVIKEQYRFESNPEFICKKLIPALNGLEMIATDQTDEGVFIYYFGEKRLKEIQRRVENLKREYK